MRTKFVYNPEDLAANKDSNFHPVRERDRSVWLWDDYLTLSLTQWFAGHALGWGHLGANTILDA